MKTMTKPGLGGRPLKFKSNEELKAKIDKWLEECQDKEKPLTITGLALALDTNRQTLINYEEKEEYFDTIKKAKLMCENYAEEYLYSGKSVTGAIFNLKNNYGWKDTQEIITEDSDKVEELSKDVEEIKEKYENELKQKIQNET